MNDDSRTIGVGPHPLPWPTDTHYDPELLAHGDQRNVEDRFRYWRVEAIKDALRHHSLSLEIAIENWQHDYNIGTIVRSANAFNVRKVHIIGRRHWNRRGAMVTDRYLEIVHHPDISSFRAATSGMHIVAVDNVQGAVDIAAVSFVPETVLVFGGEGPGVSDAMLKVSDDIVMIAQSGSTRSLNVGVAAGILMYEWRRHTQA